MRANIWRRLIGVLLGAALVIAPAISEARSASAHGKSHGRHGSRHHGRHHHKHRHHLLPVSANAPTASLVFDADSGLILHVANPDQEVYPASLTKMMTLYLTFRALGDGCLHEQDEFVVSQFAASASPTKLGLHTGEGATIDDLIRGAVTESANDAARALAEGVDRRCGSRLVAMMRADLATMQTTREADLALPDAPPQDAVEWKQFVTTVNILAANIVADGSEEDFARLMTLQAQMLGMDSTVFRNASGLPDMQQITTAPDFAALAYAIVNLPPEYYDYFSLQHFYFHGQDHHNHNMDFLTHYDGADGVKTGYTESGGFNVVDSAKHGPTRLIAIVMGRASHAARESEVKALMDAGFQLDAAAAASPLPDPQSDDLRVGDTLDLPDLPLIKHEPQSVRETLSGPSGEHALPTMSTVSATSPAMTAAAAPAVTAAPAVAPER